MGSGMDAGTARGQYSSGMDVGGKINPEGTTIRQFLVPFSHSLEENTLQTRTERCQVRELWNMVSSSEY